MRKLNKQIHGFHLVDPSPWPLTGAFSALMVTFGGVLYMHGYFGGSFLYKFGFLVLLFVIYCWWNDIVREATFEGQHTKRVQTGLKIGTILLIVSEIMFFVAFFWAFFHSSFNPTPAIGGVWPPAFIAILNPWKIPLLNTILLVTSGVTLTLAHHAIIYGNKDLAVKALIATVTIAGFFTYLQYNEYASAPFSISTTVYGSVFYMLTGLHGAHVLIGTLFLTTCLFRLYFNHFTRERHTGFETAAWYWHFVDIVWILLYIIVYLWGSYF